MFRIVGLLGFVPLPLIHFRLWIPNVLVLEELSLMLVYQKNTFRRDKASLTQTGVQLPVCFDVFIVWMQFPNILHRAAPNTNAQSSFHRHKRRPSLTEQDVTVFTLHCILDKRRRRVDVPLFNLTWSALTEKMERREPHAHHRERARDVRFAGLALALASWANTANVTSWSRLMVSIQNVTFYPPQPVHATPQNALHQ